MKRRVVATFLLAFAVWPAFHFASTLQYDVDPWKLFGWAMYCVPGPLKTLRIVAILEGGELRRLDYRGYAPEEQQEVDRFRQRWGALGRLAQPDAMVAGFLERYPEFEGVVVARHSAHLDRDSARLVGTFGYSTHWRDGRIEPVEIPEPVLRKLFEP